MQAQLGLMLSLLGALGLAACKQRGEEGSLLEGNAEKRPLVIVHGGHWSCGTQAVDDPNEALYAALSGELPASTEDLEGAKTALCSLSGEERERAIAFAQETTGKSLASVSQCPNGATLRDEGEPRERMTPLTMDMITPMRALITRMEGGGAKVDWIATCYPMGDATHDDPPADGRFKHIYLSHSGEPTKTFQTSRVAMWRMILEKAGAASNTYVIGHSHGGWTGMQTLLRHDVNLAGLVTIDPISLPECNYNTYRVIGTQIPPCLRWPNDVTAANRRTLATRAAWWLSFYVTSGRLHSGPAHEAVNRGAQLLDSTHGDIDTHDTVWQRLSDRIAPRPEPP